MTDREILETAEKRLEEVWDSLVDYGAPHGGPIWDARERIRLALQSIRSVLYGTRPIG